MSSTSSKFFSPRNTGLFLGRSAEQQTLSKCLDEHGKRSQLVVVSGASGVGKTELVRHTFDSDANVLFVVGKHNQLLGSTRETKIASQSHESYGACHDRAWVSALENMALSLARSKRGISFSNLDGESREMLTQMVPSIANLLNSNPTSSDTTKPSSQRLRLFSKAVINLFKVLTEAKLSIVLLLDDIQWANDFSLKLMETVIMEVPSVVVVATWDDKMLDSSHDCFLDMYLKRLEGKEVNLVRIALNGLSDQNVRNFVIHMLDVEPSDECDSLTNFLLCKTCGNPFFLREYMQFLVHKGLVRVLRNNRIEWREADELPDSARQLIKGKLTAAFDAQTIQILQAAACLESRVSPELIQCSLDCESVVAALNKAASAGFLQQKDRRFEFIHDEYQVAVYETIDSKGQFHLGIARHLVSNLDQDQLKVHLFLLLRQCARGLHLIEDQNERYQVATFCVLAGRESAQASDFQTASQHLQMGLLLLDQDGNRHWIDQYDLCLGLYNAAAEVAYTIGNLDRAVDLTDVVIDHARRFLDKLSAYSTRVYCYGGMDRLEDAIETGLFVLRQLGENFPLNFNKRHLLLDWITVRRMLRGKSMESFLRLPNMTNPEKLAAMQILNLITMYVSFGRPQLSPFFILRMIRLTLSHGACAQSSIGYVGYAVFLCSEGRFEEGYQFGQLALKFVENHRAFLPRVTAFYHYGVQHWFHPISSTLEPLQHASEIAFETGDIEFAITCHATIGYYLVYSRHSLTETRVMLLKTLSIMIEYKQTTWEMVMLPALQWMENYIGLNENPTVLTGAACNEETEIQNAKSLNQPARLVDLYMMKMELAYVFGDYELAADLERLCGEPRKVFLGSFEVCHVSFMQGLVVLAMAKIRSGLQRVAYLRKARRHIKTFGVWARTSTHVINKLYLLRAEYAAVLGRTDIAKQKYAISIATAAHQGNWFDQAIAEERFGRFMLDFDDTAASSHLRASYDSFTRWEAFAKLKQMEKEYSCLSSLINEGVAKASETSAAGTRDSYI